jgi:uncharacterized protein (DUF697 family)
MIQLAFGKHALHSSRFSSEGGKTVSKNEPPDDDNPDSEDSKKEFGDLGGWHAFKGGEWFLRLFAKSFRNYYERGTSEYFKHKYSSKSRDFIAAKLISVAARNSMLLGAGTGAVVSTDGIVGLLTGGEGGVGVGANVAIAVAAVGGEAVSLVRIQLKLIANLARVYEVPLDPDDPEDILTIIAFALGGSVAEAAGKFGMRVGGNVARRTIRRVISKEVLEALKSLGRKIGVKILQRTIIKYTVPLVSVVIGGGWNFVTTKTVGRIARKHFASLAEDLPSPQGPALGRDDA